MKTTTLILIFSIILGLFSCSKMDVENQLQENNTNKLHKSSNILIFSNYAEFLQIWDTISSLDESSICNLLYQRYNHESFAEEIDEFYDNIDWELSDNTEDLSLFLTENQNFFSITLDDVGDRVIEPALSSNMMRWFINEDRLFQIGDTIFKVLENLTVGTNLSDILVFEGVNETNVAQAIGNGDVFIFSENGESLQLKDGAHNCGIQASKAEWSGPERVNIRITVAYAHLGGYDYVPKATNEWTQLSIKGYRKKLGAWVNVSRTITCDVKIATGYYNWNSYTWNRKIGTHATNGTFTKHLSKILTSEWTATGFWVNSISHFDGYDCWGKIPGSPRAELKCNTHLVN